MKFRFTICWVTNNHTVDRRVNETQQQQVSPLCNRITDWFQGYTG
uniref:Uncharacterized protein n=1 Tax=Anguilla anguilla TaxID=7936 RepID=A0A0E9UBE8_ANGAN